MTLALAYEPTFYVPRPFDTALGDDARALRRIGDNLPYSSPSIGSSTRHEAILEALTSAFQESDVPGWDGYGARPAQFSAMLYAIDFIQRLPPSFPIPDVGVDKDGDIALEWDYEPRRLLSIRVASDGTMHYAGLSGLAIFNGTEVLSEGIPEPVSVAIGRVTSAAAIPSAP